MAAIEPICCAQREQAVDRRRRRVGFDRAAATGLAATITRTTAGIRSALPARHLVRAARRDRLGGPASGTRIRLRPDVLAPTTPLDRRWRVRPTASAPARPVERWRPYRLVPRRSLMAGTSTRKRGRGRRPVSGQPQQQTPCDQRRCGHPAGGDHHRRQPPRQQQPWTCSRRARPSPVGPADHAAGPRSSSRTRATTTPGSGAPATTGGRSRSSRNADKSRSSASADVVEEGHRSAAPVPPPGHPTGTPLPPPRSPHLLVTPDQPGTLKSC